MNEKIFQQLKLACGQTTSISDITLNKIADTLAAGITEETQIAAAIEAYKPILQSIDGNINFVAAKAVKDSKPTVPPAVPPITITPPDDTEPLWFAKFKAEQVQKATELEQKISGFEKAKSEEQMIAEAKSAFFKKYRISDAEKPLCEKALAIELKMNKHESADTLITGWKAQYEDFRSASGLGGIDPIGNNEGGGGKKGTPILNELKSQLVKAGKLPAPQTN